MMRATPGASLRMGHVALTVHDLGKVSDWYQSAVGLHRLASDGETVRLGVGDRLLVELRRDPAARMRGPREAGLFHTAILLPERADLGRWILDAMQRRTPVDGASDHDVSEAVYLTDPEGNGVEIYADRPDSLWTRGTGALVSMTTEPLDVPGLAAAGQQSPRGAWQGVPEGTVIGHVHLQVGTLPEAEAFYHKTLGLDVTCHYPGAIFYAADGYHHHIATNIWNSRGAGRRDMPSTGLSEIALSFSAERAAAVRAQSGATGGAGGDAGEDAGGAGFTLTDPWGTPVALTTF